MTIMPHTLTRDVEMRLVRTSDSGRLADGYAVNREHLAPWEPQRNQHFFTEAGQRSVIESKLELHASGIEVPWILVKQERVIGVLNLTGIVRGPFLNANLGYWIDKDHNGRGICTSAVAHALAVASGQLGLHRVQAATLPHNEGSQKVLARLGFTEIGTAPAYLKIAGAWRDHILYQRILGEEI